ncbi:helix-turn-helix transcriptional regulator [Ochrobactrum sp. S1502_03]|uniref:helix-turn-helix transcriptional regulator n=1 Tax=Ochrobactrum sp. S1502_03 TaxID=3108451 RepID=UPI0037C75782
MNKRLSELRERLGWSQAKMAHELGVSQPSVWRIENGKQAASKSVEKLIEILETQPEPAA